MNTYSNFGIPVNAGKAELSPHGGLHLRTDEQIRRDIEARRSPVAQNKGPLSRQNLQLMAIEASYMPNLAFSGSLINKQNKDITTARSQANHERNIQRCALAYWAT
ncbi:MAG: hypothetical protein HY986_14080 [Candidatus Melainabacteria bacterium]|nr:hypothetical protein [Candidatus Melainabacteria bacterium]